MSDDPDSVDMTAGQVGVGGGEQSPAARKEVWTGHLKRGDAPDKIVGTLTDQWGWKLRLEGVRDPEGGYRLVAYLDGAVPKSLRQPAIDGEET